MIRVRLNRDHVNQVVRVELTGHAEAAPRGRDLVCAAVSAVTLGIIHAAQDLLHVPLLQEKDAEQGSLVCALPAGTEEPQAQFLLQVMASILQALAKDHPHCIRLVE